MSFVLAMSYVLASDHLSLAEDLVDTTAPSYNTYASGSPVLHWEGVNGYTYSEVSADCSGLVDGLFNAAYPTASLKNWMGCTRPIAQTWYDNIVARNKFTRISRIADITPGDILVYSQKCANTSCSSGGAGCSKSGHMMIASSYATARVATAPIVAGTTQYEIYVIDAASSPHGTNDSRYLSVSSNVSDTGIGEGLLRLYVSATGAIAGHSWSTQTSSVYYSTTSRPLVVGRYTP